jgi:hypothetical protein
MQVREREKERERERERKEREREGGGRQVTRHAARGRQRVQRWIDQRSKAKLAGHSRGYIVTCSFE